LQVDDNLSKNRQHNPLRELLANYSNIVFVLRKNIAFAIPTDTFIINATGPAMMSQAISSGVTVRKNMEEKGSKKEKKKSAL